MTTPLPRAVQDYLLALARATLARALGGTQELPAPVAHPALQTPARAFVSWYRDRRLLACMGGVDPSPSLRQGVEHYAVQSGLHDPRKPGIELGWLGELGCRITVLDEPVYLDEQGFEAIAAALSPGPGVIVRLWTRKAIFLPGAWEQFPDPTAFLRALCAKAGIDLEHEDGKLSAWSFQTQDFSDLPDANDHGTPDPR